MSEETHELAIAMAAICDRPGNPVAWLKLEDAGITFGVIAETVDAGEWEGPVPDWDSYPSRELRAAYRGRQKC